MSYFIHLVNLRVHLGSMNHECLDPLTSEECKEAMALREEVNYYKSLIFADINPQTASVINALRFARETVEENERLRSGDELKDLRKLCDELERENAALKRELASKQNTGE